MKVLMSRDTPDGRKLEELLDDIVHDLLLKNRYLEDNDDPVSAEIKKNNEDIINNLVKSIRLQMDSMQALDEVGEDFGPRGTPRI